MGKLIKEGVCNIQTPVRTETIETVVGGRMMCVKTRKYAFGGESMSADPIKRTIR